MIYILDIDEHVHHWIAEGHQGNFLIEIKYSIAYILLDIKVLMTIVVENVIVLGHHTIVDQIQNGIIHLPLMIEVVLRIHTKIEDSKKYSLLFRST
jgi:hypothetical protein